MCTVEGNHERDARLQFYHSSVIESTQSLAGGYFRFFVADHGTGDGTGRLDVMGEAGRDVDAFGEAPHRILTLNLT